MTRWELHVNEWSSCTKCFLHRTRQRVVLARGEVPCDVLFVGEAPGDSENVCGQPFVGPAGRMLDDDIIAVALEELELPMTLRMAYSNLLACIPLGDDNRKVAQPDDSCIEACKPRLMEFVAIADPKLIVCVGKLAWEWLEPGYKHHHQFPPRSDGTKIPMCRITHPSAILQGPMAARSLMIRRCIITLQTEIEKIFSAANQTEIG